MRDSSRDAEFLLLFARFPLGGFLLLFLCHQ
jgi:hypothetical protein